MVTDVLLLTDEKEKKALKRGIKKQEKKRNCEKLEGCIISDVTHVEVSACVTENVNKYNPLRKRIHKNFVGMDDSVSDDDLHAESVPNKKKLKRSQEDANTTHDLSKKK